MRDTGLCFPVDAQGRVLLGRKKRGFGAGKWNGFGGKIEAGETIRQCTVRELREEAGLLAEETALQGAARLFFRFQDRPAWNHWGYVYMVYDFQGTPQETEEMAPAFFAPQDIPYSSMWKADALWLPKILAKQIQIGEICFSYDGETVLATTLQPRRNAAW
ncbi:hydrolase, NUDIX family [Veillonellaceae bacterium DNF00751]|uniref:8-oxo-dGTP diphosphatase n=1 Tax=uncultured Megasphaera sp. TaxID=165188 RepID=UPI0007860509|nr:8-oxo-dGTP diphosphatase [uncultured Megasphaera sp.]KXB91951.1 hydrolase, NUDIX family [Veillonellaceae bacterium DNF00751]